MKAKQSSTTLSRRQIQVLQALTLGETSKETAQRLGLSPRTVESHRKEAMRAMDTRNSVQACFRALEQGLIKPGRQEFDKLSPTRGSVHTVKVRSRPYAASV